ncbi:3-oxo-tetronate kinase [Yoonia sp. 2307UL14-13]|uniref:3-oxo-tetronate kinase n=1 Tax=Yoonia sp. 2307UL14-13 TaxID=3126506 RepID=UPI0030A7D456
MLLGCIGDDFTGSSDLANTLAKGGMRVTQYTGVPSGPADPSVQAGVVALKSRSIAPQDAVTMSLDALAWLQAQGCQQFFFKYCSTFDSTPDGNIGPILDALADALDAEMTIVCPAFPGTGRSVYQGHLFVNDKLLSESGMENHPLTPMTDPDIRRWLGLQTKSAIGHIGIADDAAAVEETLERERIAGHKHIVCDAIRDDDLIAIGMAGRDLKLISGGSGVALGLPANFGCVPDDVPWTGQPGKTIALSGSCSAMTRKQVAYHAKDHPSREIPAEEVLDGRLKPEEIADWLVAQHGVPLAYTSADPAAVARVQNLFGKEQSATALETFFGHVAHSARDAGATRIIAAGGETSGAIVEGLGLSELQIGPEIDPGIPALRASDNLVVALKSGNFGDVDFFEKADEVLGGR